MKLDQLIKDIKFNCDVSDAGYWGFFSICGLLLRYRDLYRSETGQKPWSNISREDIAAWIEAKEAQWPELEHKGFRNITLENTQYHPFDVAGINNTLNPHGLVYGAGYGMYMKPSFFLAELKSSRQIAGLTVYTSGLEIVRDLLTASAMLQEETVFLRLEPLSILLHFKFSELNAKRNETLEAAFASYGFHDRQLMDDTLEARMDRVVEQYGEIILYHEIAEYTEGILGWKDILSAAGDRKNEHYLRALKDLIADTSDDGPIKKMVETMDRGALGISVSLMEGFQRALFPEIKHAYRELIRTGDWELIEKTRVQGYERFIAEREKIVEMFRRSVANEDFSRQLKEALLL